MLKSSDFGAYSRKISSVLWYWTGKETWEFWVTEVGR